MAISPLAFPLNIYALPLLPVLLGRAQKSDVFRFHTAGRQALGFADFAHASGPPVTAFHPCRAASPRPAALANPPGAFWNPSARGEALYPWPPWGGHVSVPCDLYKPPAALSGQCPGRGSAVRGSGWRKPCFRKANPARNSAPGRAWDSGN